MLGANAQARSPESGLLRVGTLRAAPYATLHILCGSGRDLNIDGLMDNKPHLLWASHYLSALAKALMDDAGLGMMR